MAGISKRVIVALAAAVVATACSEAPTSSASPDLSIRAGKSTPPAPSITVVALGSLPYSGTSSDAPIALALNNGATRASTRAAGATPYETIPQRPFTWTSASGISPLLLPEKHYGWPYGVSDNGVIVGETNTSIGLRAFIATAGAMGSYLPLPAGATRSTASGISADGACISGSISGASGGQAVIWRNGVIEIVGQGSAAGVSNDCQVVAGNTDGRAAIWRNIGGVWTLQQLPSAGRGTKFSSGGILYSEAEDVSPSGEYVAGSRRDSAQMYAVVWRATSTGWVPTDMPGVTRYAFGVDNSGRAVGHNGSEPMLWTRASTGTYTAKVLPGLERTTVGWAAAINELGQVAGRSRNRSGWVPVLWTIL